MQLRSDKGAPYTVTADDALWLARAVEAEGPVQTQVAAVLLNGFTWARAGSYRGTLTSWVRSYAQPINPRWFVDGDLYLKQIAGKSSSEVAELRALAEKRKAVHSVRTTFSQGTQDAVRAALNGRVGIPPSATDYAAPKLDASKRGYTALTPVEEGRNRLWTRPGAERWSGYITDATEAWPWLVGVALVGGFVAWRYWGAA